ncbi:hypothetical protein WG936_05565 [Corynebacterium sp. H127]|uniref:hypothetical protein n=1 Tax=Corynebacterium sp. H127 TaxID=3133418 RepID=UPI0030A7CD6B
MTITVADLEKARYATHENARAFIDTLKKEWDAIPKIEQAQMMSSLDWANGVTRSAGTGRNALHPDLDTDDSGATLLDLWSEARKWMGDHAGQETRKMYAHKAWAE